MIYHVSYIGDTIALRLGGSFSIVSCCIVLSVICTKKQLYSKLFSRMVAYVALSDLLEASGEVVGLVTPKTDACAFQAVMSPLFCMASMSWVFFIAVFTFRIIILGHRDLKESILHHCICWGIPAGVFIQILVGNFGGIWEDDGNNTANYGVPVCGVYRRTTTPRYVKNVFFWVQYLVITSLGYLIILLGLIVSFQIWRLKLHDSRLKLRRLYLYGLAIIISKFPMAYYRHDFIPYGTNSIVGIIVCGLFALGGFFNSIVFFSIEIETRKMLYKTTISLLRQLRVPTTISSIMFSTVHEHTGPMNSGDNSWAKQQLDGGVKDFSDSLDFEIVRIEELIESSTVDVD